MYGLGAIGSLFFVGQIAVSPVAAQPSGAIELLPKRISGYFNWRPATNFGKASDGDFKSGQKDEHPEVLDIDGRLALVWARTLNDRTSLAIMPDVAGLLSGVTVRKLPERRYFGSQFAVPMQQELKTSNGFDTVEQPAVVARFGQGIYRVRDFKFQNVKTCPAAQIDVAAALARLGNNAAINNSFDLPLSPITCRDVVDVAAVGPLSDRTYLLFDSQRIAVAKNAKGSSGPAKEIGSISQAAWLGSSDREFLFARPMAVAGTGKVNLAIAFADGKKTALCVIAVQRRDLERGRLPKTDCASRVVFETNARSSIGHAVWRGDGVGLAVIAVDRRTKRGTVYVVDVNSRRSQRISGNVVSPKTVNVPFVAPTSLGWVDNTLYWLQSRGRQTLVGRYHNQQVQLIGLPDDTQQSAQNCEMSIPWSVKFVDKVDRCRYDDDEAATNRRLRAVLGRPLRMDDVADPMTRPNLFNGFPAWIGLTCSADRVGMTRAARLADVSWFFPFKGAGGRHQIAAGAVVQVAMDGIDEIAYNYTGAPLPACPNDVKPPKATGASLPPVVRIGLFEVAR